MSNTIGAVFDSGMGFPVSAEEVKKLIKCTENVLIKRYINQNIAYADMMKIYHSRGIQKRTLLASSRQEDLAVARYASTISFEELAKRNESKFRWFTLWSLGVYGIFNDIDSLVDAFFTPNIDFILCEVNSPEEAINDLFVKYANVMFPVFPYCGGVPLPMLNTLYKFNDLMKSPYPQYLATNCIMPKEIGRMLLPPNHTNPDDKLEIARIINPN